MPGKMEDRRLLTTTLELAALLEVNGSTIYGAESEDHSGWVWGDAGDINGDGYADFSIGSQTADGPDKDRADAGAVHVLFGGPTMPSTIDLASLGSAGITIHGTGAKDAYGNSAQYTIADNGGDLNGDGFDDLIVTALSNGFEGYVIFGGSNLPPTIDLAADGAADITISGSAKGGKSAGDVNRDGFDDLALYGHVVFGGASLPAIVDLNDLGSSGLTLTFEGVQENGRVTGAGDVNSDGYADVLVESGEENYLIFGGSTINQAIDLATLGSAGATILGRYRLEAAGDVNGDGYDDILAKDNFDGNHAAVIFGRPTLPSSIDPSNLGAGGVLFTRGEIRFASSAGDVNADGFDDLLLAEHKLGRVNFIYGGADLSPTIDLQDATTSNLIFKSIDPGDTAAYVSPAGDVNNDGFDDFLIGALGSDGPGNDRIGAGESYLIYGGANFPGVQVFLNESFEVAEWNGAWAEDSQSKWFRSSQRASDGTWSAEVDGNANNSTLELSNSLDLSGTSASSMSFEWLIEGSFDSGEYVALDISADGGASWIQGVRELNGNQSQEDVWHKEVVDMAPYATDGVKIRFRATVSSPNEDANVDNIQIIGVPLHTNTVPGVSVSPTAGLQTSESGATATFDVVLDSQPTADVTIAVSSSNTAEGTVNVSMLTFTPANWGQSQTILVTGVDDLLEDGDVAYTIILGPAVSDDVDYDGLDPTDAAIINLDDDTNYAPVAANDAASLDQDTQAVIDVLSNDFDPENAPLTISSVGQPSHGSVFANPDQTLTYIPNPGFSGGDSFTYEISDGEKTDQATVTITVNNTTVAPMWVGEISLEPRQGGRYRAVFVIHDENDQPIEGVQIQVSFAGQTYSGTTDDQGRFRTNWVKLNAGESYLADVTDLLFGGFDWNDEEDDDEVWLTP